MAYNFTTLPMLHDLAARLESHVLRAEAALRAMDDAAASSTPSGGGWCAKEILGHLIDSASNNHQRFVRGQQAALLQLAGYEQDFWVGVQGYRERPWSDLVTLWAAYNRHLAHVIRRMDPQTLGHRVQMSPDTQYDLHFFVTDYERHLLHHLKQIGV